MDVTEAIETRIEVREYADDPVGSGDKRAVLDAGRLAPSGRNLQHWRFVLVDDADDLDRVGELSSYPWVGGADFAVAVLTDPDYPFHEIDAGRAVTHMQLAAWERGIGSCICTTDDPDLRAFLGVPDSREITLVAGFGYPTREIRGIKDRKPLPEVAFRGRYGEPLGL